MKTAVSMIALLAMSAPLWATPTDPEWPADAFTPADKKVLAYYEKQCMNWAAENKLAGGEHKTYMERCVQDMHQIAPVGFDESE